MFHTDLKFRAVQVYFFWDTLYKHCKNHCKYDCIYLCLCFNNLHCTGLYGTINPRVSKHRKINNSLPVEKLISHANKIVFNAKWNVKIRWQGNLHGIPICVISLPWSVSITLSFALFLQHFQGTKSDHRVKVWKQRVAWQDKGVHSTLWKHIGQVCHTK